MFIDKKETRKPSNPKKSALMILSCKISDQNWTTCAYILLIKYVNCIFHNYTMYHTTRRTTERLPTDSTTTNSILIHVTTNLGLNIPAFSQEQWFKLFMLTRSSVQLFHYFFLNNFQIAKYYFGNSLTKVFLLSYHGRKRNLCRDDYSWM